MGIARTSLAKISWAALKRLIHIGLGRCKSELVHELIKKFFVPNPYGDMNPSPIFSFIRGAIVIKYFLSPHGGG
jgi:hypothetical protein